MGKANDKKVVRECSKALLAALGNLFESERERQFRRPNGRPMSRGQFVNQIRHVQQGNVTYIETGRVLSLTFPAIRPYLAAIKRRDIPRLRNALQQVHSGLRELDRFVRDF